MPTDSPAASTAAAKPPLKAPSSRWRNIAFGFFVFMVVTLLFAMCDGAYLPRFLMASWNYRAFAIWIMLLPLSAFATACLLRGQPLRVMLFFLSLTSFVFPSSFMAWFAWTEGDAVAQDSKASVRVLLSEVRVDKHTYRLYQSNCGATCSLDLVLMDEVLWPNLGMKWVRAEWYLARQAQGSLMLDGNTLQVQDDGKVLYSKVID
ncbi:hypothetical protein ACKC9G_14230 [Pokkaliibacter sp. CJK22405]|uniref:hypothetical protein n=1 Tax=Pokkaliibacter sp. CJK22405 TaxID=3384615 RepID=UPI0039848A43